MSIDPLGTGEAAGKAKRLTSALLFCNSAWESTGSQLQKKKVCAALRHNIYTPLVPPFSSSSPSFSPEYEEMVAARERVCVCVNTNAPTGVFFPPLHLFPLAAESDLRRLRFPPLHVSARLDTTRLCSALSFFFCSPPRGGARLRGFPVQRSKVERRDAYRSPPRHERRWRGGKRNGGETHPSLVEPNREMGGGGFRRG